MCVILFNKYIAKKTMYNIVEQNDRIVQGMEELGKEVSPVPKDIIKTENNILKMINVT